MIVTQIATSFSPDSRGEEILTFFFFFISFLSRKNKLLFLVLFFRWEIFGFELRWARFSSIMQ